MEEVLALLGEKLNYTQELLMVALILGRTMPMIMLTPFLGGQVMPPEIKMGLGLLLTILVWPIASTALSGAVPFTAVGFFFLIMKEVFIGMIIGFVNAQIFYAMDMAGRLIDTVRGTSMSEVMVPHSKQRATPTGSMYYQLLLVIFFALGGHHVFLEGYFMSFARIPINEVLAMGVGLAPFSDYMIRLTSSILVVAVTLAAPVIAATFITDVVFGILNRVAPQLNAYFMSMPVKALGGIMIIFISFGAIVANFEVYAEWAVVTTQGAINYLVETMEP